MGYLDNAGLYVKIGPETATPKVAVNIRPMANFEKSKSF